MINTDLENASKIMIGSLEAEAIYVGSNLIWNSAPYDAEIEYLESSGTQWIDTGIIPTTTSYSKIKFNHLNGTGVIYGFIPTGVNNADSIDYRLFMNFGHLYFDTPGNRIQVSGGGKINQIYEIELGNNYIKDLTSNTILSSGSKFTQSPLYSIKLNYDNESSISSNKWYYVKIYDNDTLILDLIPVRKDGIGYMFDKVSKTLFANQGTGDFILGPDKYVFKGYTELEYLESTGTLYIDTGYKHNTGSTKYKTSIMLTDIKTNEYNSLFGARVKHDGLEAYYIGINRDTYFYSCIGGNKKETLGRLYTNIKYNIESNPSSGWTINNTLYNLASNYNDKESLYNCYLYSLNQSDINIENSYMKIYYFLIYEANNLILDLIPIRIGSIGYMYDTISKQLFGNQGTGSFILGPDKT